MVKSSVKKAGDQNKTMTTIPDFIPFMYHGHILWLLFDKNKC